MKKINLINAISDFFARDKSGDQAGELHEEIIKVHLNSVFNKAIYEAYMAGIQFNDYSQLDAWSRVYVGMVTDQTAFGTTGNVQVPFTPVQLPNNMGIRQVSDAANPNTVFAPIDNTSNVVFSELEVDTMDDTPTFRVQRNNISPVVGAPAFTLKLDRLPVVSKIISVDIMMIVPLEQVDDFDEIAMPSSMEDDIIRQVIDLIGRRVPAPSLPDNVVNN